MKSLLNNKKILIIVAAALVVVAAAVAALLLLSPRGEEEPVEEVPVPVDPPIQYTLGETKVFALPTGSAMLVYEADPITLVPEPEEETVEEETAPEESPSNPEETQGTEGEEEPDAEEETSEEDSAPARPIVAYRYEEMTDSAAMVGAYVTLLTTEDVGYVVADADLKEAEEVPDLTAEEGTVYLTYVIPEVTPSEEEEATEEETEAEPQAIAMRIDWDQSKCAITVELVPASLTVKPPESNMPSGVGGYSQTLTFSGAVDTFKSMHPSMLELEGESMDEFRVYSREGVVLINDQPCMRLDVYRYNKEQKVNEVGGSYFLSADGLHLYRFNEPEQTVRELPFDRSQLAAMEESLADTE